jgi:hypothetical protein
LEAGPEQAAVDALLLAARIFPNFGHPRQKYNFVD